MAKYVRGQSVGYSRGKAVLADDSPNALSAQPVATVVEEDGKLISARLPLARREFGSPSGRQPRTQRLVGQATEGYETLLIALPGHAKKRPVEVDVVEA